MAKAISHEFGDYRLRISCGRYSVGKNVELNAEIDATAKALLALIVSPQHHAGAAEATKILAEVRKLLEAGPVAILEADKPAIVAANDADRDYWMSRPNDERPPWMRTYSAGFS